MTTGLDQTAAALDLPIRIDRIMEMIPHRYPLLLIDRIVELTPGESAVAIKNVTMNEPQFERIWVTFRPICACKFFIVFSWISGPPPGVPSAGSGSVAGASGGG